MLLKIREEIVEKEIKIGVCDDQAIVTDLLNKMICNILSRKKLDADVCCYLDGQAVLEDIGKLDILFLDIEMPKMDGIDVGKAIRRTSADCKIIMATSRTDRFKEVFQIEAFRFVTKPFQENEVESALDDAINSMAGYTSLEFYAERVAYQIAQRKIAYIRAYDSYVEADINGIFMRRNCSLAKTQELLDERIFYRVSREYIVNFYHISDYKAGVIKIGEVEIKVSRRTKKGFEQAYRMFDLNYR